MVRLFAILILSTLAILTIAPSTKFCSPVCGTRCDGHKNTDCAKSCPDSAWKVSGDTCEPSTTLGWKLYDSTPDYGGTLTVTGATATLSSCGSDMKFYGYVNPGTISVSSPGITVSYFAMKMYVGIIILDVNCWNGKKSGGGCGSGPNPLVQSSTLFNINFNNPEGAAITNPFSTNTIANNPTRNDYCGSVNNFREYYYRVSQSYPVYSTQNALLKWDITCTQATNLSALWGIRQFLIIIQSCNVACLTCYGPAATQCTACAVGYFLSNNTCSVTCLTRFGQTLTNVCVYCDLKCTACYMEMDNCSACTVSGNFTAFLSTSANANYPTCVNPCTLTNEFPNKVTRTCDLCDGVCATCINSANYCTSCIPASTYWTGFYCYNPCPIQYYIDPNGTNCTKCNVFCSVCSETPTNCTECVLSGQFKAFLQNSTALYGNCSRVCSGPYYGETFGGLGPNLCLPCPTNCSLCTGNPTPCTQCYPGFYLIAGNCTDTCPNGTFPSNISGTGQCLYCDLVCVDLSINMYFPSVTNDKVYIDMVFTQTLNYSTFNQQTFQNITITSENIQYTADMFTFTFSNLTASSYRITIQPKTYIFLYNATFTVLTKDQSNPIDYSVEQMPFKVSNYLKTASLTWFLIKGPPFNSFQIGIMNSLSKLSTKTNKVLALPYVQQIKKTGVFTLLFSGAPITSCSMLSNQIQSQNLYEGVRIFAVFVFFDAPQYQQISDKTKRFVSPTVQDTIRNAQQSPNRALFSTDTMYWRFQRTGQTSFFIFDVYMPMFLIFLCWVGIILAYFSTKKRWYVSYASNLYSAVHKIHQISLMYITMASIVEFIYFQPSSSERIISAIICIIFNVYFVIYQLYIYQDMIKYPLAEIGNKYYDYFVLRYGFFLKNVRFQEYDANQEWTPKHWFRPYNFHILSYYKKFLMIITLPLFYTVLYAQMGILMFIQLLEVIRVWTVWPFVSEFRNYFRLTLDIALFFFFMINTIQISVLQDIMKSDEGGLESLTKLFYGMGWAGFVFCLYFNLGHICIGVYDLCTGLKISNRAKMDNARKKFYFSKISEYQKDNESSSKALVNRWVKLGNLNDKSYGELPQVNIRVEFYQFKKVNNKFQLRIKKITSLKMKSELKRLRRSNNTTAGGKIQKEIVLSQGENPRLYSIISQLYKQYEGPHVQTIRLKTFLNVWQKDYEQGQDIPFDRDMMFQRIELISYDNQVNQSRLQTLIEGFPLSQDIINHAI